MQIRLSHHLTSDRLMKMHTMRFKYIYIFIVNTYLQIWKKRKLFICTRFSWYCLLRTSFTYDEVVLKSFRPKPIPKIGPNDQALGFIGLSGRWFLIGQRIFSNPLSYFSVLMGNINPYITQKQTGAHLDTQICKYIVTDSSRVIIVVLGVQTHTIVHFHEFEMS